MIVTSMHDCLELAERDLSRLSKKYKITIESKSKVCQILWWHDFDCTNGYNVFKTSYIKAEDALGRWLHGRDSSDYWLALKIIDKSIIDKSTKFVICKKTA